MSTSDDTRFEFIELMTIMHALNTEYRDELQHGAKCRTFAVSAEGNPDSTYTSEKWLESAASSDARRAAIEAIVAKMPDPVRKTWNKHRAGDAGRAAA